MSCDFASNDLSCYQIRHHVAVLADTASRPTGLPWASENAAVAAVRVLTGCLPPSLATLEWTVPVCGAPWEKHLLLPFYTQIIMRPFFSFSLSHSHFRVIFAFPLNSPEAPSLLEKNLFVRIMYKAVILWIAIQSNYRLLYYQHVKCTWHRKPFEHSLVIEAFNVWKHDVFLREN